MDGTIRVESSLGSGTCMTVFLPVDFAESPVSDEPSDGQPQCDDAIDFSRLRVLIVDDVEMNCMMLEGMLEALGLPSCEVEHDGSLAVERIRDDDNFDLILMDVRMPTMDGLEATRQIRQLGFTKPVIAVTANAFDEDRQDCLAAGMNSFLSKPVNMDELQRVMIEVLA
jgi:CheY-like chemotaxis protein